jgi:hypothetical protein
MEEGLFRIKTEDYFPSRSIDKLPTTDIAIGQGSD